MRGEQRYLKRAAKQDLIKFGLFVAVLILVLVIAVRLIEKRITAAEVNTQSTEKASETKAAALTLNLYGDTYTSDHKFETYLFVGTDDSGNEDAEDPEDYVGGMADFINLLVIDHTDETYALLPINRDTVAYVLMMEKDGSVEYETLCQIGEAHGYGANLEMSAENTVNTISKFLGDLPIDGSFVFPMDHITEVNSAVGGVTVTIEGDLTAADPAFTDGATLTLTDEQAAAFVRARMTVGDGTNAERMARQSQYLSGMKEKLYERMKSEPDVGITIFDKLKSYAVTDMNGKTISRLANNLTKYKDLGSFEFDGDLEIGQLLEDGLDHYEFYVDSESQIEVMTELFSLTAQD
jgi:anionic cell wall polymer biosynthesis LytR-Cps2A-Psr (LCP) family protein